MKERRGGAVEPPPWRGRGTEGGLKPFLTTRKGAGWLGIIAKRRGNRPHLTSPRGRGISLQVLSRREICKGYSKGKKTDFKKETAPLPLGEAGVRATDLQRLSQRERDKFARAGIKNSRCTSNVPQLPLYIHLMKNNPYLFIKTQDAYANI